MRPALKPGLATVWRNRDTVQIGIDPRRAIALTGMRGAGDLLRLLDGSRDRRQVLAAAGDLGMDAATADRVLTLLAAAGALDDLPAGGYGAVPAWRPGPAGARTGHRIAGARGRRRRRPHAGPAPGGLRAGARREPGRLMDRGDAHRRGHRPGGGHRGGRPRRLARGWSRCGRAPPPGPRSRPRRRPDLVILADTPRRELPAALVRRAVPHLAAAASEAIGVVGPLVLPGRSACLRCLDLTRAEHDPAWPLILAQLASQTAADPLACDTVLATMVAAQAAAQALAFVDQGAAGGRDQRHPGTGAARLAVAPPHLAAAPALWLPPPGLGPSAGAVPGPGIAFPGPAPRRDRTPPSLRDRPHTGPAKPFRSWFRLCPGGAGELTIRSLGPGHPWRVVAHLRADRQ